MSRTVVILRPVLQEHEGYHALLAICASRQEADDFATAYLEGCKGFFRRADLMILEEETPHLPPRATTEGA